MKLLNPDFACVSARYSVARLRREIETGFPYHRGLPSRNALVYATVYGALGLRAVPAECSRITKLYTGRSDILELIPDVVQQADEAAFLEYQELFVNAELETPSVRLPRIGSISIEVIKRSLRRYMQLSGYSCALDAEYYLLGQYVGRIAFELWPRPDNSLDFKWVYYESERGLEERQHSGLCAIASTCDHRFLNENVLKIIGEEAAFQAHLFGSLRR